MRNALVFGAVLAMAASLEGHVPAFPEARADNHGLEVTSVLDNGASGGAVCPHESLCTLRRALQAANLDTGPGSFTITFSNSLFPPENPSSITVSATALPNITRSAVIIDATGRGVTIAGSSPSLSTKVNGLTVTGSKFMLFGTRIHGFSGSCVAILGEDAVVGGAGAGSGNVFGGCDTGLAVSGAGAVLSGNLIGFTAEGASDPVESGLVIAAGDVTVGGPTDAPGAANRIGFADTAIFVGSGSPGPFTGVLIERNVIGLRPTGEDAAVGTGVVLAAPSSGAEVISNAIHNATTGIVVRGDGGAPVTRNRLTANTFDAISGMAIDLGDDDIRNQNDDGDADTGANTLLNHPVIGRATQASLSGTACQGCRVEVYAAAHEPGGSNDYGRVPLSGGVTTADGSGAFNIANPAAAAGEWLVALAIDADGNTSEFGPPARVGAGAVLCGNVQLHQGWTHAAYFGAEPVALFSGFPPGGGAVTAIYRYVDGSGEWERWFADTAAGWTLHSVQPGESYWFLSNAPVTLAGGFSISFPVPVALQPGGNDFVYLGASAHPLDALSSLATNFTDLYRFDSSDGTWDQFGDASVPSWAQDLALVEACGVYQLRVAAAATLVPLQP